MLNSLLLADVAVPDSTLTTYKINQFFTHFVHTINEVEHEFDGIFAIGLAKNVAAICVLLYLGWEMWPVIMGRKAPDVMKLLKPIFISMIILGWQMFYVPFYSFRTELADSAKTMFDSQQNNLLIAERRMEMKLLQVDTLRYQSLIVYMAAQQGVTEEHLMEKLKEEGYHYLEKQYIDEEVKAGKFDRTIATLVQITNFLAMLVEKILKWLSQIALQVAFCGILIVGNLGCAILAIFGPLMFALSISNTWRNLWVEWINKYLCIALYPFLGYLAMTYVNWLIEYFFNKEYKIGDLAIMDWDQYLSVTYNHFGIIINYLIGLWTGAYVMRSIPEFARMIFPGVSGSAVEAAGQAVYSMTMAITGETVAVAAKTAKTVAAGGAIAAAGAVNAGSALGSSNDRGTAAERHEHSHDSSRKQSYNDEEKLKDTNNSRPSILKSMLNYVNPLSYLNMASAGGWGKKSTLDQAKMAIDQVDNAARTITDGKGKGDVKVSPDKKKPTSTGHYNSSHYKTKDKSEKSIFGYTPQYNDKHRQHRSKTFSRPKTPLPAKMKYYWKTSLDKIDRFILYDDQIISNDPQAWAHAIKGIKSASKTSTSLPWIFAEHYKKHSSNGTYKAMDSWQKERSSDIVFVRRTGYGGYVYQTYGNEAHNLARLTGEKVRYVRVGTQKIATFTLNKHNLQPVIHRLNEMGLSVNVINAKGRSLYYKEDITLNKIEQIDRIKAVLNKNQGTIMFDSVIKDAQTEKTGNGLNIDKIDIKGVVTDIYGALHIIINAPDGRRQSLYLDRLTEAETQKLADTIQKMDIDQKGFSAFNDDKTQENEEQKDSLNNVYDEFSFAAKDDAEYQQKSKINRQQNLGTTSTKANGDTENNTISQKTTTEHTTSTQQEEHRPSSTVITDTAIRPDKTTEQQEPVDPFQQHRTEREWVDSTPLNEAKQSIKKDAKGLLVLTAGGMAFALNKFRIGRWVKDKAKKTSDKVANIRGYNDKTQADIHKDIRAGIEWKWHLHVGSKDNVDYNKRAGMPLSVSLRRQKHVVINRGRDFFFEGVDMRNHSALQKTTHNGWRFMKFTSRAVFGTVKYAAGVAAGRKPLISVTSVGIAGFKATIAGMRWISRKTTAREAVIAWKRENKHNYAIVRRHGIHGSFYQTYGEDAMAIARILHKEDQIRVLKMSQGNSLNGGRYGKNVVPSLVLTADDLKQLDAILQKHDLTMDVINTKGRSVLNVDQNLADILSGHLHETTQDNTERKDAHQTNRTDRNAAQQPEAPDKHEQTKQTTDETAPGRKSQKTDNKPDADNPEAEGPVILDYSTKDAIAPAKTYHLKDKEGNVIYIVTGETLSDIIERMTRAGYSLRGIDLSSADLRDANLKEADLTDAILVGANLRGARLQKAKLTNADLRNANLRVANLYKADLENADLSYTDLRDTNLKKTNLNNVRISHANIRGTLFPNGITEDDLINDSNDNENHDGKIIL